MKRGGWMSIVVKFEPGENRKCISGELEAGAGNEVITEEDINGLFTE